MKKRFDRSGTARRKAAAVAALTIALVLAVGGAGAASLLSAQPETLTVGAVVPHVTVETPQAGSPAAADPAPEAESTATAAPEPAAESTAQPQQAEPAPEQTEKPETAETAPAEPEEAVEAPETPETPAQPAGDAALEEENFPALLLEETPELAAQDPQAPAADGTAQNDTASQHTPEDSVLLTPEQIQQALDSGALEDAEAQCIDLTDENGFFRWLFNWLFGIKDKEEEPAPAYSGWRTENGKTYYYDQNTHQPVTGIQSIDNRLYYFDASGVQQPATFGIDVSKYQSSINWEQVKSAGVEFAIIRIGYRGYGSGALVQDPKFEEHFTNARNAGLRVGIYCFSQAVNENEAREEAQACVYVLNGRQLDYPIYFDTEASGAGNGRADGLGVEDRTKCAVAFCEEVKALGYKPGVYASTTWFRKRLDMSQLSNYYIWNAHYNVASSPIACNMWQGTCTARIPGYGGQIDVNISYMG